MACGTDELALHGVSVKFSVGDKVYGQSSVNAVAILDPDQAIRIADSYAVFAYYADNLMSLVRYATR